MEDVSLIAKVCRGSTPTGGGVTRATCFGASHRPIESKGGRFSFSAAPVPDMFTLCMSRGPRPALPQDTAQLSPNYGKCPSLSPSLLSSVSLLSLFSFSERYTGCRLLKSKKTKVQKYKKRTLCILI